MTKKFANREHFVIAIDGPAASGKGTIARALAKKFNFAYLDTGKLYRKTAAIMLGRGEDPLNEEAAVAAANMAIELELPSAKLRTQKVSQASSEVAKHPKVRSALLSTQRNFASHPPANSRGVIMDGRDIGSVVCPDADIKLYITASTEVRASRRVNELNARGESVSYEEALVEIRQRDERDQTRKNSPLLVADDALLLETDDLSIEQAIAQAEQMVGEKIPAIIYDANQASKIGANAKRASGVNQPHSE